ncbi:MAG: hypothetical protein R3345_10170, partial [Fulvivirga sp.]|nr:hypothetical protein [Fulvivirga sp.]
GMTGGRGTRELIFGSITADLMDKLPCTIIAIPYKSRILNIDRVAVASDKKSMVPESQLYVLNFITEAFSAKVDIFHVAKKEATVIAEASEVKESYENLFKYNIHRFFEVKGENLLKEIKKYVEEHQIDLLALLHHRSGNHEHKRSITKQLAFSLNIPLLVIPVK